MPSRTVKSDRHYRDHARRNFTRLGMGVSVLILGFGGYMFTTASETESTAPTTTADPAVAPTTPPDVTIVDVTTTTAAPAPTTEAPAPPTTEAPGPDPDFLDPAVGFAESEPVTVTRVVTAGEVVLRGGRTVRLAGIDAPAADACYGDEARQALIRRLSFADNGGQVRLYSNGDDDNVVLYTDPSGPLTPEVNADLILVGAADIRPGWRDADFRTGRDAARAERLGLWGEC